MTLTTPRKRLFRVADQLLSTRTPARNRRGDRALTLSADVSWTGAGRLARLKRRSLISGDASTLWKVKGSRWRARGW